MTEKRFEIKINNHNQCDIIDWVESEEKNAICIYNDLGDYHFSSAKALCELLNELNDENQKLKKENEQLKQHNQQITKVLEDGGVILTKNQLKSLIEMKNDDSVEVRYLKTANAKLKDEIRALREYIQKKELSE